MTQPPREPANDEGFLLLALVVVCFLLILFLGIAAPRVARQLERDREVESEHRAQEYVRAIQLYYRKYQRFPASVEQLLGSGTTGISTAANVRFLRQEYKDPLTHDAYRLIPVGTAKTEVKGFFGEPLVGAPAGSLGAVAGLQSNPGGQGASALGGNAASPSIGGGSAGFSLGGTSSGTGSTASGLGSASSQPANGTTPAGTASTGSSSFGSGNDATTFQGSKGAFVGVASNAKGHGLVEWNGSENIEDWEFLYDPRVELLKAKVSIFGGSPAASGSGSFGTLPGAGSTSIFAPAASPGATGQGPTTTGVGASSPGSTGTNSDPAPPATPR